MFVCKWWSHSIVLWMSAQITPVMTFMETDDLHGVLPIKLPPQRVLGVPTSFASVQGLCQYDPAQALDCEAHSPWSTSHPTHKPTKSHFLRGKSIICCVYWNFSQLKGGNVRNPKEGEQFDTFFSLFTRHYWLEFATHLNGHSSRITTCMSNRTFSTQTTS